MTPSIPSSKSRRYLPSTVCPLLKCSPYFPLLLRPSHHGYAGFAELCYVYSIIEHISHDEFTRFVDPANTTAQLLLAHFFLIEHEIGMLALRPVAEAFPFRGSITTVWIHDVAARLPSEYSRYLTWPIAYTLSGNMRCDIDQRIPLGGVVT